MIYLDQFGHLLPDPESMDVEELHEAARLAGMRREWFQSESPARFPHYDLMTRTKRQKAMRQRNVCLILAKEWMRRFHERGNGEDHFVRVDN